MNYPVWELSFAGGGLLIAMVAVIHVFISHFSVGGGLFLVLTEIKANREKSPAIMAYVKAHTRFFVILTMVFGALTGVGIWFTISLLNPAAVSVLVHNFVFAWAIEWVLFFIEILSLIIYYHTFDRLDPKIHQLIGWIYFISAWLSLVVINGIIGFMLTPGAWLVTGNFWDGLLNPVFWPSMFFRTFLALIIAGLFGMVTATFQKDREIRQTLVRYGAHWLLCPFGLLLASAWWYRATLPPALEEMVFSRMPGMATFLLGFAVCSALIVLGGLVMAIRMPARLSRPLALVMLLVGLTYIGSFEFIREKGRKPFVIHGYMYANSILTEDLPSVKQNGGVLQIAKWSLNKTITDENRLEAGAEIFTLLCLSCHSVGGPFNNILKVTDGLRPMGMKAIITTMGSDLRPYMPPFAGTNLEKGALVEYLTSLQQK
ncbi:MAG: cytochrome ubiquinol oxidase subunit I [Proteobacteria bacterium]|nr:cytochrome ubiquinol oxidase subunit I [Pseudomonadota bacterium]MBU1686955.1 cytochrome ubiquinol oxidase subunit I [Pseudomonadota bacterium]